VVVRLAQGRTAAGLGNYNLAAGNAQTTEQLNRPAAEPGLNVDPQQHMTIAGKTAGHSLSF